MTNDQNSAPIQPTNTYGVIAPLPEVGEGSGVGSNAMTIEDAHTSGGYSKRPLTLVRGAGCTVYDDAGNAYLDATSGMGVALLGHAHPAVVSAIADQAATLITCAEIFYNDRRAELYTLLADLLPGDLNRFFLCNSGAEAIEGALKVARLFTGRSGIVAAKRAFHGRTLGALGATFNSHYREPFAGWIPDVTHVSYNDLEAASAAITDATAAVLVEAVQGEGGVHVANADYLRGLRDLCDQHGALLIVDEIQTGLGRTGRWFGFEHSRHPAGYCRARQRDRRGRADGRGRVARDFRANPGGHARHDLRRQSAGLRRRRRRADDPASHRRARPRRRTRRVARERTASPRSAARARNSRHGADGRLGTARTGHALHSSAARSRRARVGRWKDGAAPAAAADHHARTNSAS